MRAAVGASNALLCNIVGHLFKGPAVGVIFKAVCESKVFNELICTVTGLAVFAVHQRVGETAHVARGNPNARVDDDRTVETYVVTAFLHKALPPSLFDVVEKFYAKGAVVPGVGEAAVNFGAGEHEAAVFAKRDDFIHCFLLVVHDDTFFLLSF